MENFAEKLQERVKAIEAKIEEAIEKAKFAVVKSAQTAQAFQEFAEEVHAEKIAKFKSLNAQTEAIDV